MPETSPAPINPNIFDHSILLIVEDGQGSRDVYSGILMRQGYRVIRARNAAEAAERIKKVGDIAVGLPLSSALRKINEMCAAGLLDRRSDPGDGRRSFVTLTDRTKSQLLQYSSAVKQTYEWQHFNLSGEWRCD